MVAHTLPMLSRAKLGEEVYLAYLPAAHILELVAEITFISMGGAIG
jgi:long-subunit acyl-CoA synthetase (AMP-forming)